MFGPQDTGYEFSAQPRVVDSRPKFRDPYGQSYDYIPQNIMHDSRIARGSTNASMVIPAGNHPDAIFLKKKEQQRRVKIQQEEEERRRAEFEAQRDIKTPEPLPGRVNLDIQTEPFVENLTDKPTEFEIGVQSDFYIDRPPTPLFVPIKTGQDAETQVEKDNLEEDVYDFNEIVDPILSVLCFNTIEQAQMEVYEEHEFNHVDTRRKEFERLRNLKLIEAQRLEATENRKKEEMERRNNQVKARKTNKVSAHQKYTSRQIAKKYLSDVCGDTLKLLEDHGTLVESLPGFLHEQAVPWLYAKTMKFLNEEDMIDRNTEELVETAIAYPTRAHHETVEQDHQRLIRLEKEEEARLLAKEERRRKRAEAREEARKQEEILKFKEEVRQKFIEGGEQRDHITIHEITEPDGNCLNIPIIGLLGGHFLQMIYVLNAAKQVLELGISSFFQEERVYRFMVTYIHHHMKGENFFMKAKGELLEYCVQNKIKPEAMHKSKEEAKKGLREFLLTPEVTMLSEFGTELKTEPLSKTIDEFKFDPEITRLLQHGIVSLLLKTPLLKEGVAKDASEATTSSKSNKNMVKLDPAIDKIKLCFPQKYLDWAKNPSLNISEMAEPRKARAVARIRIPFEEVKEDEEEEEKPKKSRKKDKKSKNNKNNDSRVESSKNDSINEGESKAADLDKSKESNAPKFQEQEIEDRVTVVNPKGDDYDILVFHQAAGKMVRKDILNSLVKQASEFKDVDIDSILENANSYSEELELKFIEKYCASAEEGEEIHHFDYEIN
ncbi:unnamed protein product [Moneuplotes crassus]|uniref:Uncharacterized protein n=1 Tax=Euplotes crassus TaxID=5936 RepID=A0AAD1YA58_EUPCR|nr:unnamed protein product [Moneuplotes crassus]